MRAEHTLRGMSSGSSSRWTRRRRRIVYTAGAAAVIGALRAKAIERKARQDPYILDPSLPAPCDTRRPA